MARRSPSTGVLRVAVVGAIGRPKGFDVLVRLVERAARDRAPFFLTVIGFTADDGRLTRYENAEITGSYKASELGTLLAKADPDFVFLSSVWPETYSDVLSEIWDTGYPVVAFDIGAPADRIRSSGGGILIPLTRDTPALLDSLMAARERLSELGPTWHASAFMPSLEAYYAPWFQRPEPRSEVPIATGPSANGDRGGNTHEVSRADAGLAPFRPSPEQSGADAMQIRHGDEGVVGHPILGRTPVLEKSGSQSC